MIQNFVTDADLEVFYPDMISFLRGGQIDFSDTIAKAFKIVVRDVINKGFNPRLMMVPIDLNRDASSTNNQHLLSKTVSADNTGYAWQGRGREGRFKVTLSSRTANTGWSFLLQGSNENSRPDDASTYWTTIQTVSISTAGAGTTNYTFTDLYKWYRLKVTLDSGTGSVAFTAGVYETAFDEMIAHKAMEIAFAQWTTRLSNQWEFRYERARTEYQSVLEAVKFGYDEDEDGIAGEDEVRKTSVRFRR